MKRISSIELDEQEKGYNHGNRVRVSPVECAVTSPACTGRLFPTDSDRARFPDTSLSRDAEQLSRDAQQFSRDVTQLSRDVM